MPKEEEITKNLMHCPRFNDCSVNICILDPEVNLRNRLPEENPCPFTIKKRSKEQKGIRLLAPDSVLKVVPESNKEMLNKGNLKRWHKLR
jgi:hypothetical protein